MWCFGSGWRDKDWRGWNMDHDEGNLRDEGSSFLEVWWQNRCCQVVTSSRDEMMCLPM